MAQSTTQTDTITLEPGLVSLAQLRNIYTSHRSFDLYTSWLGKTLRLVRSPFKRLSTKAMPPMASILGLVFWPRHVLRTNSLRYCNVI